ncbi:hypothetical protein V5P93_002275 [Actinokineospora auranticolor]|uniref:WD40 repeat protein n=1 Tax=Actinokineospora auranticolor TaxID=155976 RepID=A0A2S6GDL4_9PSEU|nr:hypothetical protein [Actinokineospora auranticolor]PPK63305.1 hypothetical protein CLV40_12918 [Actinokineospora auranticolor]
MTKVVAPVLTEPAAEVVASSQRDLAASATTDGDVRLWRTGIDGSMFPIANMAAEKGKTVGPVALSVNGRMLFGSGRFWDLEDPTRPRQLPGRPSRAASVVFSPDGRLAASVEPRLDMAGAVHLWDTCREHDDPPLASLPTPVRVVAFASAHVLIVSGDGDIMRPWNVSDPRHPVELGTIFVSPRRGDNEIRSVAISPDGLTLAVIPDDEGPPQIWNLSDPTFPTKIGELTGAHSSTKAITFSADGKSIITAGDNTLQKWNIDVERIAEQLCTDASPRISPSEWREYGLSHLTYRPPCA